MANRKFNRTKSKVSRRGGALSNRATCPCPCLIATRTCPAVMGGSAASARTAAAAASVCEHGRRRSQCKDCGGSGLCEHGRRRSQCKDCVGGGHVTFLEAREVEEDEEDGEDESHERLPTVRAHVVLAPRGGKRKR
eukprot:scaffold97061_cov54-Phaeocystis_antarctica.AAC.3